MKDKVKVKTEVKKDIPKIIAEEPALISYSKADFISTVATLAASDDEGKLEDILPYAEEICQRAGERYNELVVAEQNRELKKALEAESSLRYVRVEYIDGDVQYWATDIGRELMSGAKFFVLARNKAYMQRPFMEIRYADTIDAVKPDEKQKDVRNLETSEIM